MSGLISTELASRVGAAMVSKKVFVLSLTVAASLSVLGAFWSALLPGVKSVEAEARRHHAHGGGRKSHHGRSSAGHSGKHHGRGSRHGHHKAVAAAKSKHAYPLDFFMMKAPDFDRSPLEESLSSKIHDAFSRGIADDVPPEKMVRAGVFHFYPLSGGIFKRREDIKYIVLHSTETGIPIPAKNVINGWNSMGRRHPGAQYVVERDGTIYQALDPELGSVHVNIFKTLPGINNDNTIGIEMNHTGRQDYPAAQRQAVVRLLTYLQHRYKVTSENVITHRYAQQGDHTDPVNFDLENFLSTKEDFRTRALAMKRSSSPIMPAEEETEDDAPLASVYVQIHGPLPSNSLTLNQGSLGSEPPMLMPPGTFVAGGRLSPGSSPASESKVGH